MEPKTIRDVDSHDASSSTSFASVYGGPARTVVVRLRVVAQQSTLFARSGARQTELSPASNEGQWHRIDRRALSAKIASGDPGGKQGWLKENTWLNEVQQTSDQKIHLKFKTVIVARQPVLPRALSKLKLAYQVPSFVGFKLSDTYPFMQIASRQHSQESTDATHKFPRRRRFPCRLGHAHSVFGG